MGRGGDMFRTWSGPGGSSHKGPLTSALSYSECFILQAATSRLLAAWASSCKDAMDIINFFISLLSDPRSAIAGWIVALGAAWVYTPLFLIVFVETGLVFFPFLPGDSLLFAAGVFSADGGGLHLWATLIVFYAAAILGNTSNYWIARFFGKRIIDSGKIKALTPERMAKLDHFFERYGGLTIVITRFMPFFRTFAPFIAGTGHMNFGKFTLFNAIGGISWVLLRRHSVCARALRDHRFGHRRGIGGPCVYRCGEGCDELEEGRQGQKRQAREIMLTRAGEGRSVPDTRRHVSELLSIRRTLSRSVRQPRALLL